jgi:hypothetical protein
MSLRVCLWLRFRIAPFCLVAVAVCAAGCTAWEHSTTDRTAIEQLLLTRSTDRAVELFDLSGLAGRTVYLDTSRVEAYEKGYAIDAIRDRVGRAGGQLTEDPFGADVIAEARVGAQAIDRHDTLFGLPALTLPVPLVGTIDTPEIVLWKKARRKSTCKLALHARDRATGRQILSTGPRWATAYYNRWTVLFLITFPTTDLPEKKS